MTRKNTQQDFWNKVDIKGPDDCWNWTGALHKEGWGVFRYENSDTRKTYRLAITFAGQDPTDKVVRHSCDNPTCCNPAHLSLGTQQENIQDRVKRNRSARAYPGNRRLTDDDIRTIRQSTEKVSVLARQYNLSWPSIKSIIEKKCYKDIE